MNNTVAIHNKLTDEIISTLNQFEDVYVWHNQTGAAFRGKRMIRFGCKGSADIIGTVKGKFVALEVKTGSGRQKEDQKKFQEVVEEAGGFYSVVRSTEQSIDIVGLLTDILSDAA
jgi:hypothetical protein